MMQTRISWLTLTVLLAAAWGAQAQQTAYCNGVLMANAAYSNVLSNGRTSQVDYHVQMQNVDPQRRTQTVSMLTITRIGNYNILQPVTPFDLSAYQQKDVKLFSVNVNNPSGVGAPSPSQVLGQVRFTCSPK